MINPFALLLSPRETLSRLNSTPRWMWRFIILSALSIILYISVHPFLVQATLAHLPPSATLEEKEVVAQTLRNELPLRCAFLPFRLLLGWSSFAFLLFGLIKAFAPPAPVRILKVFSLEVLAELFNLLAHLATLLALLAKGIDSPNATSLIPFSAAAFVHTEDIIGYSLLNSLNFFTLLYIVLLSMGISVQSGLTRSKSVAIVLLAWTTVVLFNAGALKLLRDTMHLLI